MPPELQELLERTYYGNTVGQWAAALGLIVLSIIVGRLLYWILGRWVKALARRTETRLDDLLVDMLEEPAVGLVIVFGLRYALGFLSISEQWLSTLDAAVVFAVTMLITWLIVRVYDALHQEYLVALAEKTENDLDDQLLPIVRNGVRFVLFTLGLIVGLNNAGFDVGAVLAGLGIGGLAFALAAQDTVANLFGGVTIFLQRPFKLKDRIEVAGIKGYVTELGLRTTRLQTASGEKIQVPNKFFTENSIRNLDDCDYYYAEESFRLHRNTSPEQLDALLEALGALTHKDMSWSMALVAGLDEFGVEVKLAYGVHQFQYDEGYFNHYEKLAVVKSCINRAALGILREQTIRLALPVHISLRSAMPHD